MASTVYTKDDLTDWCPERDLGEPATFPFTRGIHPFMYRKRLWTMRQYAGFGTATESNRRYRYLLEQGVSGLRVAFDLPTQISYDSDHALAAGQVGRPIKQIGIRPYGDCNRLHNRRCHCKNEGSNETRQAAPLGHRRPGAAVSAAPVASGRRWHPHPQLSRDSSSWQAR